MKKIFMMSLLLGAMIFGFTACEKGLTEEDVQNMINDALATQETGVSEEYVQDAIDNAFEYEKFRGHAYVDLGLPSGTLWATCNVGASKPEECGSYFAWGETAPKSAYNWSTLKYFDNDEGGFTKYTSSDNRKVLESIDDAASVNWGGVWRMPTIDEIDELFDEENCALEWIADYNGSGMNGCKVTSNKTKGFIFLPAAGCRDNSSLSYLGKHCYYWSSSLNTEDPYSYYAYIFYCRADYYGRSNNCRYYGQSVRPVCSK